MLKFAASAVGLAMLSAAVVAQTAPVLGDRTSPLRPLGGDGNVGISNAVLRDQPEVRTLRVVVEAGGTRAMHAHSDVRFHLFVPISAPMEFLGSISRRARRMRFGNFELFSFAWWRALLKMSPPWL